MIPANTAHCSRGHVAGIVVRVVHVGQVARRGLYADKLREKDRSRNTIHFDPALATDIGNIVAHQRGRMLAPAAGALDKHRVEKVDDVIEIQVVDLVYVYAREHIDRFDYRIDYAY